jgi:integrase
MAKKRGNNEGTIVRRKDGRWMASITIGRDPQTGKLKRACFYGKTRQEVAALLSKALRDKGQGVFVAPHKLTLGAWLDTWLRDYKQPEVRPTTFDNYETLIRCHLQPALGHIPLKDLRPDHLQRFYNDKVQAGRIRGPGGLNPKTVQTLHILVSGALEQAVKHQLVARNVSTLTIRPRTLDREMATLTLDQVATQLLPAITHDRLFPAVLLAFSTGLRRGELLAVRWQDLDLMAAVVHIRQHLVCVRRHNNAGTGKKTELAFHEPKTPQSQRTLPLTPECVTALRRHKAHQAEERLLLGQAYQDHGLVFCKEDGRPLNPKVFLVQFQRRLQRAGLPKVRIHDARHTFATLMLELGESPKTVQTLLGHSKIATTLDIYSHVSLELETRAVARLDAALKARTQAGGA